MASYGSTVEEIRGLILRHRDDQRAWQIQLEDAYTAERQALGAMQAAQDLQRRAREAIDDDAEEISRLQDELADLIPRPREPE